MNHNTVIAPSEFPPEDVQDNGEGMNSDIDMSAFEQDYDNKEVSPELIEADDRFISTPSETVTEQTDRFASRSARIAQGTANRLTNVADRLETEGARGIAAAALRRIGRIATSPLRVSATFAKNKTVDFFEAGNKKFDEFLKAGEKRFEQRTAESEPVADITPEQINEEAGDSPETTDTDEDMETYRKKSAKVIDWVGEKIDSEKDSGLRRRASDRIYDYAVKVDDRDGTYASRGTEKIRNGIDSVEAWGERNDGNLLKLLKEKGTAAKERRETRVKKERLRTIGRKFMAYHRAGKEAAKSVKPGDHQDNYELRG